MIVREIKTDPTDVLLIPGDIHADQQDDDALSIMMQVAVERRVNNFVLVGDSHESTGLSRHGRPARNFRFRRGTLASEAAALKPWLGYMQNLLRTTRSGKPGGAHVLTGNHEAWFSAVQDDYPGFLDTPWHELYGDLYNGWHVYAESTALRFGPLLICHGHRLRGSLSKNTALAVLQNYPGQNTLYGHTHRVDAAITPSYKYGSPVLHGAWSVGHMKRMDIEMKDRFVGPLSERHRQGFGLVTFKDVEGELRFNVELVTIDRTPSGRPYCIVGGLLYD